MQIDQKEKNRYLTTTRPPVVLFPLENRHFFLLFLLFFNFLKRSFLVFSFVHLSSILFAFYLNTPLRKLKRREKKMKKMKEKKTKRRIYITVTINFI